MKAIKKNRIRYSFNVLFIILFLFISSCKSNEVDENGLKNYINNINNGLNKFTSKNGITYRINFKPTDLIIAQELKNNNKEDLKEIKNNYKDKYYFNLTISTEDGDLEEYSYRRGDFDTKIKKLLFQFKSFVSAYNERGENIHLIEYLFPRTYGHSNSTSFLLIYLKRK